MGVAGQGGDGGSVMKVKSSTKPVGTPEVVLCEEAEPFRTAGRHGFPLPSFRDAFGL